MTIRALSPLPSPIQILVGSLFGTPLAGWILARGAAKSLTRPTGQLRPMLLIGCVGLLSMLLLGWLGRAASFDPATVHPGWVQPTAIAIVTLLAGGQFAWYARWIGNQARGQPSVDWIVVVRVVLLTLLFSVVAVFGTLILVEGRSR